MAKLALINRELKRANLVKKFAGKRAELRPSLKINRSRKKSATKRA